MPCVLQVDVVVIDVPQRQWPYVGVVVITFVPLGSRWASSPFAQAVVVVVVVATPSTLVVLDVQPDTVCVACGMKVMVTQNVETDLDITNGARGTIVDIWLSPDEPPISTKQPLIKLKYIPLCILVKLERTRATRLKDLEESVIPVEPTCKPYRITCQTAEGSIVTRTVRRRQFPMTAAYAFTDHRSQGQTIPAVIIDIATPPTGKHCIPLIHQSMATY